MNQQIDNLEEQSVNDEIDTSIQYIANASGDRVAVVIPMEEWAYIEDTFFARRNLIRSLAQGFQEIKLAKEGKIKLIPIEDLLDEL